MKITVTQFRINYCHYISKSSIKNLCLADVEQLKIIYFSIFHSIQSIFPGINSTGTDKRCKSYVPILKLYMEYYVCYSLYLEFNYSCGFSGLYTRTETVNIRGQMKWEYTYEFQSFERLTEYVAELPEGEKCKKVEVKRSNSLLFPIYRSKYLILVNWRVFLL